MIIFHKCLAGFKSSKFYRETSFIVVFFLSFSASKFTYNILMFAITFNQPDTEYNIQILILILTLEVG